MATRKAANAVESMNNEETESKAELQRRLEETRESISHTVEEIKETVSDQYTAVKETVSDVLDWNEQFSKNPIVWGIGAVSVGLIIGYSIAAARSDDTKPVQRRRRSSAHTADSTSDAFFDGLSRVGLNFVLPAVTQRVKDLFGIDLSEQLLSLRGAHEESEHPKTRARKSTKRLTAKKGTAKKSGAKRSASRKRSSK